MLLDVPIEPRQCMNSRAPSHAKDEIGRIRWRSTSLRRSEGVFSKGRRNRVIDSASVAVSMVRADVTLITDGPLRNWRLEASTSEHIKDPFWSKFTDFAAWCAGTSRIGSTEPSPLTIQRDKKTECSDIKQLLASQGHVHSSRRPLLVVEQLWRFEATDRCVCQVDGPEVVEST
jgi:hypothetical protein